jgi:tetratricopeptide (TPR) repeat protein
MVLADDAGTPAGAVGLLRKGLRSNPGSWEIPFDLGFIYFITLDDYAKAAHYFRFAARQEDSPEIAKRFMAFAYRRAGRDDVARALWEEMYRSSSNRVVRDAAEFSIKKIDMDRTIREIAEAAERFRQAQGAFPRDVSDIVASGLMASIPGDPFGGSYFLDSGTESVSSTTKARDEAESASRSLERRVKRYAAAKGHYPQSLSELKQEGFIAEIPTVVGGQVTYDPATGRVGYDFAWRETRQ